MQLRHLKTLMSPQEGAAKVVAFAWAPNNNKLAVCTVDRVVLLFNELGEKKDKFATKPADSSLGKKCYHVSGLAFSPDSTKIAVGQTDNIIYVYKIGEKWGEKKVICNKIILQSAVTCLEWPVQQSNFVFGLADGKVKVAGGKGSKSQTVYGIESYTVSLAVSPSGKGFISGHADGTIVRYYFEDEGAAGLSRGPICRHSCPPYALAWGNSTIIAAGSDRKITVYGSTGKVIQNIDHSSDESEKEFVCASCNPSGQSLVLGSYDRLRVYNWSPRKESWEAAQPKEIPNLYTITALSWKKDGSRLVAGSLCGAVEMFDCCLRRVMYKDKFEMTYVGLSQVIVKNLTTGSRVVLKSHYGCEIERVRIMGQDRYIVAHTTKTLLLGDLQSCKLSEISWQDTGGNEKFYFENDSVCMVFNAGELTLMEYGSNEILCSVRTEFVNPHLISVRINERRQKDVDQCKKLAYLIDLHTVSIMDLYLGATMSSITHDSKINWLELNETGRKLLYRDKKLRLHLYDIETQSRCSLLNYCSYVQWVPQSDVVVAQNRNNLCVWYNIDMPDKVTMFQLKGEVVDLQRHGGKTQVMVQSGVDSVSYSLDEGLIEFGTAVDDGDYQRALNFLETLEMTPETEAMWKTLGELTLSSGLLLMAERCSAALGDVAKARYLRKVIDLADQMESETGTDGINHYMVQAKLAILNKQFKQAEGILLERGEVEKAMAMYQELNRWEDAIAVAAARGHSELQNLRSNYFQWLQETGQEEKAGELREREGDLLSAINLYMKAGIPAKAAKLVMQHQDLCNQPDLLQQIASSLMKAGLYEKAGDLYEQAHNFQQAMEAYKAGGSFRRAIELARSAYPSEVVTLEEKWGDHLTSQKQHNAAITHYIEAGSLHKAVVAAMQARQWSKAVQILELQDPSESGQYYQQIAEHYSSIKDYHSAEEYFLKAGLVKETMNMYIKADHWEEAHPHAQNCMEEEDIHTMYVGHGQELEEEGKLREAEKLYVVVGEHDLAISMYKKAKQYDPMTRLVALYHKDLLDDTHLHLAKELESDGQYKQAERHYVDGNDWKAAVNMYRSKNLWDDSYRVAKAEGGSNAANQVAYLWAKSLGGESAVKLLTKFGLLEAAIDYATENNSFEFGFSIAKVALKSKLPEIHLKYALSLEDEGKYSEAEDQFVKGGKPKEAVLMYVHQQNWDSAQRVAELHCPDSVSDVLVGQARGAFERKDFQKAETYLLRAERPDLAAKFYKEADMWADALRIVKEYLPHKLDDFQKEMSSNSGTNYEELLSQARLWEQNGEHPHAIDLYLQLNLQNCPDKQILKESWEKAVDLATKFAPGRVGDVAALVCDRLANFGEFFSAGELMLSVEMVKEALDMFMSGEAWDRARDVAKNIAPKYEKYVEYAYVQYLKTHNKPDEMSNVDPDGALKMYSQNGEWEKCLELAQQQDAGILAKYVALYAADLIRNNAALTALKIFTKYGSPPTPQNFNIYKRLCMDVYVQPLGGMASYSIYSSLRDILLSLVEDIAHTPEAGSLHHREFEKHLLISHYLSTRTAFQGLDQLDQLVAKISSSLLRYTDILPADKTFYEAGLHCKSVGWESMAFVFFNRFLDLSEAIEEGSLDALDNSDFTDTDIPFEIPLPEAPYMSEEKREETKEWVLAVSMDQRIEQALPLDERDTYVASLHCQHTEVDSLPCVVTGYPVLKHKVEFKRGGRSANKEDWNKFVMATKMSRTEECMDVWKFLSKWCGTTTNPSYSFQ